MLLNCKIRQHLLAFFAFVLLLGAAGGNRLFAQVTTATITGTVTDSSGAAIADAMVEVKNVATGISQTTTTDGQGRYTVPSLGIGDYDVQASKAGFQTVLRKGLTLTVGAQVVVDIQLPVGQAQETVTVEGQVSQVETTTSTVANLVETKQMADLPLNGRNFAQLITLAPGVNVAQTATTSFYGKGDTYSVAGSRPEGHAYLLDGTDITNFFNHGTGASSLGTSLGLDAIAEFQTLTNTYSAQFSGNGAVVNAVSKSGTNNFHGTLFEYLRNSAMDARDPFNTVTSTTEPYKRNQYGGALGGPIKKDKAFFFVNYEGLTSRWERIRQVQVPDLNARNGYLPCAVAKDITCDTTTGLAYVGFGSALSDPAAKQRLASIVNLWPLPNIGVTPGTGTGIALQNGTEIGDEHYVLGRFDYNITAKDSLFARYVIDDSSFTNPFPGNNVAGWRDSEPARNQYLTTEWRRILSPTVINLARASYVRTVNSATTIDSTPLLQFYPHLGGQDGNITIGNFAVGSGLGPSALAPYVLLQNKYALSDDVYLTKGAHNIKFGLGMQRIQTFENQPFSAAGSFTFNNLEDFMKGIPARYGGAFPPNVPNPFAPPGMNPDAYRSFRETLLMPYINDDWKVTSKLTLNIGLRYDFDTNPKSAINNLLVITNPPFNSIGGPISNGLTQVPNVWRHNPSLNNWGPRFGFAYDPFKDHKTSIRGGFADTHNVIAPRTWTSGFVTGAPFPSVISTNPAAAPGVILFPNPFAGNVARPPYSNGQAVDYNTTKTPALYQWNLNIQRELPWETVLTVGYVGSHGSHLFTQSDQNPPFATIDSAGVYHFMNPAIPANHWNPNFGVLNDLQANGRSSYNALQVNAVHRFSRSFQAQVAYTWAHSIDDGSGSSGLETGGGARSNPYYFRADRGASTFDIRHAVRINGMWALPFHGNKFVEGWQLGGILSKTTGPPLLLNPGSDRAQTGQAPNQRPNLNPGWTADTATVGTIAQWYNPAAFSVPALGTEGNLGRDIIIGPGVFNLDGSLIKDTKIPAISEQFSLQFRAEFFNILNHPNLGLPVTAVNSPAAGRILGLNPGTTPRQIQLALKINF
jgi:hypothetical protein